MAYSVSQTVKDLFWDERPQLFRGTVTFPDNTTLSITESDIMSGSFMLDRTVVSGNSLELGSCIASELSFELYNGEGDFDEYDFEGAEILAEIGITDDNGTTHYVPLGYFIIDGVPKVRDVVSISALDRMVLFDFTANGLATWWGNSASTKTLIQIVDLCCTQCGITLATDITSFPNATLGFTIPETFNGGTSITYRQLLSYAVGAMGKIGWMNTDGELELGFAENTIETSAIAGIAIVGTAIVGKTVDGDKIVSRDVEDTFTESERYSSEYEDYLITTTGVYCDITEDDDSGNSYDKRYLAGEEDYAFDLTDNPFIAQNPTATLPKLSPVIGLEYTPLTMTTLPTPWIFPMDWVAYEIDEDTTVYAIVTSFTFSMNGNCGIQSAGESPTERAKANVGTSQLIRQLVQYTDTKVSAISGFYETDVVTPEGQTVHYMHNKPNLEESDTQWKITAEVISISTDKGVTFTDVLSADGTAILNRIYAIGIDASYINTGSLKANLIKTGILTDSLGKNSWNLNTGAFRLTDGSIAISTSSAIEDVIELNYYNKTYMNDYSTKYSAWGFDSFIDFDPQGQMSLDGPHQSQMILGPYNSSDAETGEHTILLRYKYTGTSSWLYTTTITASGIHSPFIQQTSDRRSKDNIKELDPDKAIAFILALKPSEYTLKGDRERKKHHGFIAQDIEEVIDGGWGIVHTPQDDDTGYKSLGYFEIIADLVATVQSQNKRIEALENQIADIMENR